MTRTAALALASLVLVGCAGSGAEPRSGPAPAGSWSPSAGTIPFTLHTHCGITGAYVESTYFLAVTPLSDGNGNPPEGWGNPAQEGYMTFRSSTEAVFTDDAGHRVEFRAEPGWEPPPCD